MSVVCRRCGGYGVDDCIYATDTMKIIGFLFNNPRKNKLMNHMNQ